MRFLLFLLGLFFINAANAQICRLVQKIPADSNRTSLMKHAHDPDERMEILKSLIHPDSICYFIDYAHLDEDERDLVFPLDTFGVHILDLDMDGDLDLIYSAQSGPMSATSTAIYLNEEEKLRIDTIIKGKLVNIYPTKKGSSIYTFWKPCCDSYTNRLENYVISSNGVEFSGSVSYIGRSRLTDVPDFESFFKTQKPYAPLKKGKVTLKKGAPLYAMKLDFRNVHPYFRDDNKPYQETLKKNEPIVLMEVGTKIEAIVLGSLELNGKRYYAILTNEMNDVAKSHFEWSAGAHRRFIAWVSPEDFE
jgi:hypothetical protein